MADPSVLARYGFPSVRAFQAAFCAGRTGQPLLTIDGVWGPHTAAAADELPYLSAHFQVDADNLRSHGNHQCLVRRELIYALELLRGQINRPVTVIDAYRDPAYNASLGQAGPADGLQHGAATNSQHVLGLAADLPDSMSLSVQQVRDMHIFSGIGYSRSTGHVLHVDMRHVDPSTNYTKSSPTNPAMWLYA